MSKFFHVQNNVVSLQNPIGKYQKNVNKKFSWNKDQNNY